jgi:hypothetical protein
LQLEWVGLQQREQRQPVLAHTLHHRVHSMAHRRRRRLELRAHPPEPVRLKGGLPEACPLEGSIAGQLSIMPRVSGSSHCMDA